MKLRKALEMVGVLALLVVGILIGPWALLNDKNMQSDLLVKYAAIGWTWICIPVGRSAWRIYNDYCNRSEAKATPA
jgi:uncharacterized membrane protein YczE